MRDSGVACGEAVRQYRVAACQPGTRENAMRMPPGKLSRYGASWQTSKDARPAWNMRGSRHVPQAKELQMVVRRTKIVATLGPTSSSPERIEALILSGLDVARLNFSHGTPDEHRERTRLVREIAAKHGRYVAIMGDLQGPKIRIARFTNGVVVLQENEPFT